MNRLHFNRKIEILLMPFIRLLLISQKQMKSGIVWIVVMKDHHMVMNEVSFSFYSSAATLNSG